jgi:UDP-N-acetylglucosamine--N-acetylmuramyl-(pentapeptide) pyrophosphoryl-undecaprenol N-acetylglucosamine transferase
MIVAVTGGGTGGHLTIAKALKNEFVKRGDEVVFIGSSNGQDRSWFENDTGCVDKLFLSSYGVSNQSGFSKWNSLFNIGKLSLELREVFKKYKFDAVVSVGGYSSAPASFLAIGSRIPLYIHEQNAHIGNLNKTIKPFAKEFFSSYEETSKVKDYPISNIFFEKARVRKEIKRVIFLGGSQGARFVNDFAIKVAPELYKNGISIIHQTGKLDFERMQRAYSTIGVDAEIIDFHPELYRFIEKSDLAVTRSGASTLWELSANGLPSLFIPYPHANNHQYFNAKFILDRNLGWSASQGEIKPHHLIDLLNEDLEEKSRGLMETISPDGAGKIVDFIKEDYEQKMERS